MKMVGHNFKFVGFIFGGFSTNPYKILQCSKCKKYGWLPLKKEECVERLSEECI